VDCHGTGHATPSACKRSLLAINLALFPRCPTHPEKTRSSIGMVATSQHVLVVNKKSANNIKELVAAQGPARQVHFTALQQWQQPSYFCRLFAVD
jgi:hypothetical protein